MTKGDPAPSLLSAIAGPEVYISEVGGVSSGDSPAPRTGKLFRFVRACVRACDAKLRVPAGRCSSDGWAVFGVKVLLVWCGAVRALVSLCCAPPQKPFLTAFECFTTLYALFCAQNVPKSPQKFPNLR